MSLPAAKVDKTKTHHSTPIAGDKKVGGRRRRQCLKEVEAQSERRRWWEEKRRQQRNNQSWGTARGSSEMTGRDAGRQDAVA